MITFIDKLKLSLQAGNGGDGCLSFRREKFIPRGGPDGGNGGKGGDIYLLASKDVNTFYKLSFHPNWKADRGEHGKGSDMYGRGAPDLLIPVPIGTIVRDITETGEGSEGVLIGELLEHGQKLLVAKGGRGGRGNASYKTMRNNAPRRRELGPPGERKILNLELKLLANVGLVGFPNAGKSTLLSRLTNAKPKIAAYPFTTLAPILGVCGWKGLSFAIADIPGLIEGAHTGKGLGDEFLRHVERTKILVHLVDPEGYDRLKPIDGVRVIEQELQKWDKKLIKTPRLIAVTKSDLGPDSKKLAAVIKKRRTKIPVFTISAQTGEGLDALKDAIIKRL